MGQVGACAFRCPRRCCDVGMAIRGCAGSGKAGEDRGPPGQGWVARLSGCVWLQDWGGLVGRKAGGQGAGAGGQ